MIGTIIKKDEKTFNKLRWSLITLFFICTVFIALTSITFINVTLKPLIVTMLIFVFIGLHGIERYGIKNMAVFFLITWFVSNSFEALSIQIGFPFGFYYYVNMIGLRILEVPVVIIFAYFAMGYISWMLSHILTGQYGKKLEGKQIFTVPFIATFIMVMWDLTMDPASSTLHSFWVWQNPEPYFGVPIMNFFGWFLVVFIILQIFAIYISKYGTINPKKATISSKLFWIEVTIVYGIMAIDRILEPIFHPMILVYQWH